MKFVSEAVNRDRLKSGIAKNDLVEALCGGVAFVGGLDIGRQQVTQAWQGFECGDRLVAGGFLECLGGISRLTRAV